MQKVIGGDEAPSKINPSMMSLLKMLTYMTYIAHILGCMWHWLTTFEKEGMNWVTYFGVEEASLRAGGRGRRGGGVIWRPYSKYFDSYSLLSSIVFTWGTEKSGKF